MLRIKSNRAAGQLKLQNSSLAKFQELAKNQKVIKFFTDFFYLFKFYSVFLTNFLYVLEISLKEIKRQQ